MFEMVLYRYFALGSIPTRVSTLSKKELKKVNTVIVYGGCGLVTISHAARRHTCIVQSLAEHNLPNFNVHAVEATSPGLIPARFSGYTVYCQQRNVIRCVGSAQLASTAPPLAEEVACFSAVPYCR